MGVQHIDPICVLGRVLLIEKLSLECRFNLHSVYGNLHQRAAKGVREQD